MKLTRRQVIGTAAAAFTPLLEAARPKGYLVENSTHMFAADLERFPHHPNHTYIPQQPLPVEAYGKFAMEAGLNHTVIVHSEVYQDDHRYLEYCFEHEPKPGYFKGTCLFDPMDPKTPARTKELVKRLNGRIVGMRIHEMRGPGQPPTTTGPMRDRGLQTEGMKNTWKALHDLGLLVQMQAVPCHAPHIAALAKQFRSMPVLMDHLAFPSRGTPAEYDEVIKLSQLPNVYMKISSLTEKDKPTVKRLYDAFGPDRLVWGGYGSRMASFERALALIENVFDFAPEAEKMKIRGGTAMQLFKFKQG